MTRFLAGRAFSLPKPQGKTSDQFAVISWDHLIGTEDTATHNSAEKKRKKELLIALPRWRIFRVFPKSARSGSRAEYPQRHASFSGSSMMESCRMCLPRELRFALGVLLSAPFFLQGASAADLGDCGAVAQIRCRTADLRTASIKPVGSQRP